MRRPLVMANWKMNGEQASNATLLTDLLARVGAVTSGAEVVICPPFPYLGQVAAAVADHQVGVGGQDCSHVDSGAYTGEVAAPMLRDSGCAWVIIGHSERRQYHAESDALAAAKIAAAQRAGLNPVLCVGETREQREAGAAEDVVDTQLRGALADASVLDNLVVAYEPVWAIGTGLTATPEIAQEMHKQIRAVLADINADRAAATRILYGGSVKAGNAAELFAQGDIDGALVGGASLDAEAFAAIIAAADANAG